MPNEPDRPRRVTVDPEGPVLIEGPVEVVLPDGTVAARDRFVVAVCTCRRSRTYPWCDTSHRGHQRPASRPAPRTDDRVADRTAVGELSPGREGPRDRDHR